MPREKCGRELCLILSITSVLVTSLVLGKGHGLADIAQTLLGEISRMIDVGDEPGLFRPPAEQRPCSLT